MLTVTIKMKSSTHIIKSAGVSHRHAKPAFLVPGHEELVNKSTGLSALALGLAHSQCGLRSGNTLPLESIVFRTNAACVYRYGVFLPGVSSSMFGILRNRKSVPLRASQLTLFHCCSWALARLRVRSTILLLIILFLQLESGRSTSS
jgi:hypothetical protein